MFRLRWRTALHQVLIYNRPLPALIIPFRLCIMAKNSNTSFTWNITGPGYCLLCQINLFNHSTLDTGKYNLTLKANAANACIGQSIRKISKWSPKPLPQNLSCVEGNDNFCLHGIPAYATDYKIDLLQGPTGVRSPFSMIFNGLADRQRVGIMVTPVGEAALCKWDFSIADLCSKENAISIQ